MQARLVLRRGGSSMAAGGMAILENVQQWRDSRIVKKHGTMVELNAIVAEYAQVLEGVATERADLILQNTKMQLQVAELGSYKTLFDTLQKELEDLRKTARSANTIVTDRRAVERELMATREELSRARQSEGRAKAESTRLKNKYEPKGEKA